LKIDGLFHCNMLALSKSERIQQQSLEFKNKIQLQQF